MHVLAGSCQIDHGQETRCQLVIAHGDAPELLQSANASFDGVTLAIGFFVEFQWPAPVLSPLVAALRNNGLDAVVAQPAPDARVTVTLVRGQASWPRKRAALSVAQTDLVHERFKTGGLVALTCAQMDGQWNPLAVGEQVDFGAKSAPGAA